LKHLDIKKLIQITILEGDLESPYGILKLNVKSDYNILPRTSGIWAFQLQFRALRTNSPVNIGICEISMEVGLIY